MRPWLWLPASWSHKLSPWAIRFYGQCHEYQTLTWLPFTWKGLEFSNRLGIAGGVDKDATQISGWWTLGPGFLEVGTITPQPQPGHRGRVVARQKTQEAVWNRLGFPSQGAKIVARRLSQLYQPHFTPIFVNLGKNKTTPLSQAYEDYIIGMEQLKGLADVFVINLSSPNTEGLTSLLNKKYLKDFLTPLLAHKTAPLLLKISPDLNDEELKIVLDVSLEFGDLGVDGWVLTNSSQDLREGLNFPQEGGVSGRPLGARSRDCLKKTVEYLGAHRQGKLIVSVGGVLSPEDVFDRLHLGADLVQVYSALIFRGPFFFREVSDFANLKVGL